MTSCISRCKDTTFNVIEIWECQWDKQLKGEAAKDYKGGHGWDERQRGVHAKRVTIMPKELVWLKMVKNGMKIELKIENGMVENDASPSSSSSSLSSSS